MRRTDAGRMDPRELRCIPHDYATLELEGVHLHLSRRESNASMRKLACLAATALRFTSECLGFQPTRSLHVCSYHTQEDAWIQLSRRVPATFAMAPFSSEAASVVIVHSEAIDPRNGDPERMMRLLAHEMTHQFVAESTGSIKVLGDENRGMRVSSWINEGLAELVGLTAISGQDRLDEALRRFAVADEYFTFNRLSDHLDSLNDAGRSVAFDHATAAVYLLAQMGGIAGIFADLERLDVLFRDDEICNPERIRDLRPELRRRSMAMPT
jgi:hypothetical protein